MTKNLMRKSAVGLFILMLGFFLMSPIIAQENGDDNTLPRDANTVQPASDAEKKTTADKIDSYFRDGTTQDSFTGKQAKELESIKSAGKDSIEKAITADDVSNAFAKTKSEMDSVLTDAEEKFEFVKRQFINLENDINGIKENTKNIAVLENTISRIKLVLFFVLGLVFLSICFIVFVVFFVFPKKQKTNDEYLRTTFTTLQNDIISIKRDVADRLYDTRSQTEKLFESFKSNTSLLDSHLKELEKNTKPVHIPEPPPIIHKTGDPVTDFNTWAANPTDKLFPEFYYVSGDIRVRTPQQFEESDTETKWITNRTGGKKYLFPNPNSFSALTNISELYKMDQSKLSVKGKNRIRITRPCEIEDKGFINYGGELQLL